MDRRKLLQMAVATATTSIGATILGCRGYQYGHVLKKDAANLVGSHEAGAEVFDPLVDEAVDKLLVRQCDPQAGLVIGPDGIAAKKTICFIGIENKSSEDIGDFKDQLYQQIDTRIAQSDAFQCVSRRVVDAALFETRLRPDSLLVPSNMQLFTAVLSREGAPIDHLLFATLTSGTTQRNKTTQRDYLLTLDLTNVRTGTFDKQSAEVRKGYSKTPMGKLWNYNPLKT